MRELRILGPLEVRRDGRPLALPPREGAVLAVLALRANTVVSQQELVDEVWGDEPPAKARASLQNAVSALRRALGPGAVETVASGYRLSATAEELDALRFSALLDESRGAEPAARVRLLRAALACWRGPPLSEFPVGRDEVAHLDELRLTALEERFAAELELGEAAGLVAELQAVVERHPLRERLWAQLMLALYRSGRQADALDAYRRAHDAFVSELGLEPGPQLRDLQLAILLQDPRIESSAVPAELLARAASLLPTRSHAERAESLYEYSVALWRLGERSRATAVLERAGEEAERSGDRALVALVRVALAQHRRAQAQLDVLEYLRLAEEAIGEAAERADDRTVARLLAAHGVALRDAGRCLEAAACLERAVEHARAAGDEWQEGWCRNMLALALAVGPHHADEVLERCETGLAALAWGPPGPLGLWSALAVAHSQLGHEREARRFVERAVEAAREAGLRSELAGVETIAALALEVWDGDDALAHLRRAHDLALAGEGPDVALPYLRAELARLAAERGELAESGELLAAARLGVQESYAEDVAAVERATAVFAAARGDPGAADHARRAVEAARRTDNLALHGRTLELLGRLDPSSGGLAEAAEAYRRKGDESALGRLG